MDKQTTESIIFINYFVKQAAWNKILMTKFSGSLSRIWSFLLSRRKWDTLYINYHVIHKNRNVHVYKTRYSISQSYWLIDPFAYEKK